MSKKTPDGDPKAADLLPPDGPPPIDPSLIMASDGSFRPEVETRKIGIRRAAGLDFGNWLYRRVNWRPAGNSRRFWLQIEADDPFMGSPARPTDAPLEVYAAQRIERTAGSLPKPQPEVARAYPPSRPQETAPAAVAPAPRKPRPNQRMAEPKRAPEPKHTPEPRPAPAPVPPPKAQPEPAPPPADEVVPRPPGRRLPPKPSRTKSGRMRTPRKPLNEQAGQAPQRPSAAEIRAAKEQAWKEAKGEAEEPEDKPRSMDDYRSWVQLAEIQEEAHKAGDAIPEAFADQADEPRRVPKIVGEAKRLRKTPVPLPAPTAPPVATTPVPEPPKPKPKPKPKPVDRSPRKAGGGGLDDLFGGAQEGRVRIGKRAKPKPEVVDEEDT